jgi:hypothetical protein
MQPPRFHSRDASLSDLGCSVARGARATAAVEAHAGVHPGGCSGNAHLLLAHTAAAAPARSPRRSKFGRHRSHCKCTPPPRSARSGIPGTSALAPQCNPSSGLDNAARCMHKRAVELLLARTAPKARG